MHLFQLIIPSVLSLAAAAPTPELEARAGHARFGYTGSATCNAPLYIFDSAGCFPVASTARAIYVYENVYVLLRDYRPCPFCLDFILVITGSGRMKVRGLMDE
jgi:hypothetical protein